MGFNGEPMMDAGSSHYKIPWFIWVVPARHDGTPIAGWFLLGFIVEFAIQMHDEIG